MWRTKQLAITVCRRGQTLFYQHNRTKLVFNSWLVPLKRFSTEENSPHLPNVRVTKTKANEKLFDDTDMVFIKRSMAFQYEKGNYPKALELAKEFRDKVLEAHGDQSTAYASSLSNIALMVISLVFFINFDNCFCYLFSL
jgi:hypothetical protein